MISPSSGEPCESSRRFARVFEVMFYVYEMLEREERARLVIDPNEDAAVPDEVPLFRFSFVDSSKNSPFMNLVLFMLETACRRGYRKHRGNVWEEIYTDQGRPTARGAEHKPSCTAPCERRPTMHNGEIF